MNQWNEIKKKCFLFFFVEWNWWMKWIVDCPFTHCLQQWLRVIGYMFWRPFHSHHSLNSINFNLLFPLPFHLFYSIKRRRMRLFSSLGQRKRRRQASRNGISETNGMEWLCGRGAEPITHQLHHSIKRHQSNSLNFIQFHLIWFDLISWRSWWKRWINRYYNSTVVDQWIIKLP